MTNKPFESRIQDLVYNVDAGVGLKLIKGALYVLMIGFVILVYTANQYRGLREAEAMDYAQLGRNVTWQYPWLVTQNVRPASIWYLSRQTGDLEPQLFNHPDLIHAPLYPILLKLVFQGANFAATPEGPMQVYGPEYRVMVLNHVFAILSGILLLLIGRRLFDQRVALLGMTLFFLSDSLWRSSLAGVGIPIVMFWALAATLSMVIAVSRLEESLTSRNWVLPVVWSALFCGLAFLTRYAAIALVPGLLLYMAWALRKRAGYGVMLFLAVFLLPAGMWMARNLSVAGSPLALAPYLALNGTEAYWQNAFERSLAPDATIGSILGAVRSKLIVGLREFYGVHLRTFGDGFIMAIFLTTFFYRFVYFPVHALRWGIALSMSLLLAIGAVYGENVFAVALMFWPLIIIYALAFFMLLLDRLQLQVRLINNAAIGALIMLSVLPMTLALLPPRQLPPYPPYAPRLIIFVSGMLRSDELLATDMPAATAWYGDRVSVLLPKTIEHFYDINDFMHRFSGLYFTPVTRDQPYTSGLQSAAYETWVPMLEGRIPSDFPLPQVVPLIGREQLFFSDRARWAE